MSDERRGETWVCYNRMTMDEATIPAVPEAGEPRTSRLTAKQRAGIMVGLALVLALVAGAVASVLWMVRNPAQTETLRDVFIILMALESLVIGIALIVLIIQIARLTNLLQNEVGPILRSTQETVSTLRGTTRFLSDNLVRPVVKVNSTMAAVRRVLDLLLPGRRP